MKTESEQAAPVAGREFHGISGCITLNGREFPLKTRADLVALRWRLEVFINALYTPEELSEMAAREYVEYQVDNALAICANHLRRITGWSDQRIHKFVNEVRPASNPSRQSRFVEPNADWLQARR